MLTGKKEKVCLRSDDWSHFSHVHFLGRSIGLNSFCLAIMVTHVCGDVWIRAGSCCRQNCFAFFQCPSLLLLAGFPCSGRSPLAWFTTWPSIQLNGYGSVPGKRWHGVGAASVRTVAEHETLPQVVPLAHCLILRKATCEQFMCQSSNYSTRPALGCQAVL